MKNVWRIAVVVAALGLLVVFAAGQMEQARDDLLLLQGPENPPDPPNAQSPPWTATAAEDDFKLLRRFGATVSIDADPSDSDVDALSWCVSSLPSGVTAADVASGLGAWNAAAAVSPGSITLFGSQTTCAQADGVVQGGTVTPGAVAQVSLNGTFVSPKEFRVTGFTITLNDSLSWEIGDAGATDSKYDGKGVIVHEAGHVLGLADLRPLKDWRLTMFGQASTDIPPDASTLGCGDLLGLRAIYGGSTDCAAEVTLD